MFWLRQPPHLRWIAAAAVLAVGIFFDTRPAAVVDYPFAAADLHAGQLIAGEVELRTVPTRLLPRWEDDVAGYALIDVAAGTPLLPSMVSAGSVPEGWWSVALPLPHAVGPGTPIRVATAEGFVTGLVSGEVVDTGFELVGSVAFSAVDAALVADTAASGAVVVMVGSPGTVPASAG